MTEATLWQLIKKNLSSRTHASRIENRVGSGISDISMCRDGAERWIELKIVKSGKIRFEPSQTVWIPRRLRAGGIVRVFARSGDRLLLLAGAVVHATSGGFVSLSAVGIYVLATWERPWDWRDIEDTLFTDPILVNGVRC